MDGSPPTEAQRRVLALAGRFEQLLSAVPAGELRWRVAAEQLERLEPELAVAVLARLVLRGANRAGLADEAVAAITQALGHGLASYERKAALYAAAQELDEPGVAALFLELPPQKSFEARDEFRDARLGELSLGHRKTLARSADLETMLKLALIGEPDVVRNVLANPRLTEALVLRIAARRPMRPAALLQIARSPRWGASQPIRRSLVRNPYTPVEIALRLLPLLLAQDWREVLADGTVHVVVRTEARRLLAGRGGRDRALAEGQLDPAEAARRRAEAKRAQLAAKAALEREVREAEDEDAQRTAEALIESFEASGGLQLSRVDEDEE